MQTNSISGNFVDIFSREIYPANITITDGAIHSIERTTETYNRYILPGFVDAHVHIESSMMVPTSFARMAVIHGTVATVSDPHEIANVCGIEGVQYMIDNSKQTSFKFFFGAPSCVPATKFETAGDTLDAAAIATLLENKDIWYLSEMMNYPGVLFNDKEVMAKIAAAKKLGKPVDGHAPGLRGADVITYASAGISTDHECFELDEALDKIAAGMKILIREGSAAKNYNALHPLLKSHPEMVMFCSDDKHPDELVIGHINKLVARSVKLGYDVFDVLRAASMHPVQHYNIPVGLLRVGDPADFIVVKDLSDFEVISTYISGLKVAENGNTSLDYVEAPLINRFHTDKRTPSYFVVTAGEDVTQIRVIEAIEGQLITNELLCTPKIINGQIVSDIENDILKIAVINRYTPNAPVALAFIKNFGLKQGAIASTVAHDCHNIVCVGVDDDSISAAVNALIDCKGGIAVAQNADDIQYMPLPVAGLMSNKDGGQIAEEYAAIDKAAHQLGTHLKAPFMTLSFMALLVIPSLKLSDKGLFDGKAFKFTDIIVH